MTLDELMPALHEDLAVHPGPVDAARIARLVSEAGDVVGAHTLLALTEQARAEVTGLGPLHDLVDDDVTDVLVNPDGSVWRERRSTPGLERIDGLRLPPDAARSLAVRLAAAAGRRLDDAVPCADARLGDGTRLHAVLPPISGRGTAISLRFPGRTTLLLDDLRAKGMLTSSSAQLVRAVVRSRANFLISGGTGAGKTTLLAAMLSSADDGERIITVEDAPELVPDHPHCVSLQARHRNTEGAGEVTLSDLVRQCLRMRPDRIVVGECRGAEIRDLLHALNTGHDGGCGTVHANAARDVPARIEALGALGGLDRGAVAAQAVSAIDLLLHVARGPDGRRFLDHVAVLARSDAETLTTREAIRFLPSGTSRTGPAWEGLAARLDMAERSRS